jgi:osmotically-inducible protein OsmY
MTKTTDIREAVEAELAFDPLVGSSSISVRNINGDVTLDGTVRSYPQYLEAVAAARRVTGVKHVHNHLAVELLDDDYRDDPELAAAANNALRWNTKVPAGIEATAHNGNITLTGTVRYGPERTAAEVAVGGLIGLRNITDKIRIDYDAADSVDVSALVEDALDRNALIVDDSDVLVDSTGNTVTLTGHVRTWAEHDAVIDATWMASGVYDVVDNLIITG